jgi:hypothetical protein
MSDVSLAGFQKNFLRGLRGAQTIWTGRPGYTVYRNTVAKGWRDAMEANYPSVLGAIGAPAFGARVRDYLATVQAAGPVLAGFGEGFALFLAQEAQERPDLAALARLDRAFTEAHLAQDSPPFDPAALAARPPDILAGFRFAVHPATRLVEATPDQIALWLSARRHPEPTFSAHAVLVTRPGGAVRAMPLPEDTLAFIAALIRGAPLGEAAAATLTAHPDTDVARLLVQAVTSGAFTSLEKD